MSDKAKGNVLVATQFLLLGVIFFAPKQNDWQVGQTFSLVLNAISVASVVLLVFAGINLGKSLTANPVPIDSSTLKTNGLYAIVRHPIYSALIMLSISTALGAKSWLPALATFALVLLLSFKARFEEKLLLQRYVDYSTYAARVGRLMPLVGRLPASGK